AARAREHAAVPAQTHRQPAGRRPRAARDAGQALPGPTDRRHARARGRGVSAPATWRATVLGAGTMGTGIAQLLLQAGAGVSLIDPVEAALERSRLTLQDLFERLHAKGRLAEDPGSLLSRLRLGHDHDLM